MPPKSKRPAPWGPDHQLGAPLEGLWNAGHNSDTKRNRRELCILEVAFKDRLAIHHMVFDYRNTEDKNQPLSWDLTQNQKRNIRCALNRKSDDCSNIEGEKLDATNHAESIELLAADAAEWFDHPSVDEGSNDVCSSTGLGH